MWEVTCNNEYYSLAHEELFGYLPNWVREYNLGLSTADNLKDHLDQTYGYGLYEFPSTIENETLVSPYEEDEDIPWLARWKARMEQYTSLNILLLASQLRKDTLLQGWTNDRM